MISERRSLGKRVTVAIVSLFALAPVSMLAATGAATGCAPNEEIVCGTTTENTGATCAAEYKLCAGGTDRIDCTSVSGGVSCACIENGTTKKSFPSNDACNVTPDALRKRAEEGCGWMLEAK